MVDGGGELVLRDAEEPFALASPTSIAGTQDDATGAITAATFSTPTVAFDLPVLDGALTANVEATITEVTPGTSTGTVSPEGDINLQTSVKVDLHIVVAGAGINAQCQSAPVNLDLFSVAPYDPDTQSVTLRDPNFFIPAMPVTPTCDELVTGNANPMLSGSGHAVTLPVTGAILVPQPCETDSTTTLAVTPEGGAGIGDEVTLTSTTVSADAGVTDAVTGVVEFRDGTKVLGQAALTGGTATLSTTTLALGAHSLTARYRGDSLYCQSISDPVAYTITAKPVFEVTLPGSVRIGAAPVAIPLTLENPSVGSAIANARLGITIQRYSHDGFSTDALTPSRVLVEREGPGGVWSPVTLSAVTPSDAPTLRGTIGAANGQPLAPGASLTESLRVSFPGVPTTLPGPLTVTFTAVQVDPADGTVGATLSSTSGQVVIRNATRAATTTTIEATAPPFTRVGGTLIADVTTNPTVGFSTGTYHPRGPVRLLIDGVPVPFWAPPLGGDAEPQLQVSYPDLGALLSTYVNLPPSVGIGTHTFTAQFLGDDLFAPSSVSQTFTVHPPVGTPYECLYDDPFFPQRFIVHATAEGRVPATATPGAPVPVEDFQLSAKVGRSFSEYFSVFTTLFGGGFEGVTIDLGEHGEGSAVSAAQTGDPWFGPPDASPVDWDLTFGGETGSITLPATPGSVITTAIEGFSLDASSGGLTIGIACEAVGDPIELGDTVVAGTTLSVQSPTPTRANDEVILRAAVSPSWATGVVEFHDGGSLVGIAAISNGVAQVDVTLPAGTHSLTARARTGASAPPSTSAPVELTVLPAHDCGAFAVAGNGAVVRLVYLELLGRCPDQAGFDYWTGRLDGGTSPSVFARSISNTPEAVGLVVDDAYQTMLGRGADATGRAFWVERMRTGTGRYDQLLADLAASPEFWTLSGSTRAGFVTRVYDRLLDRAPDAAGLEYWTDRLAAGTPRRALVLSLANQPEPLGRLVIAAYQEILGRAPFTTEATNGTSFLRGTGDRSGLYAELIGRAEFSTRAQSFPNPED